MTGSVVAVVPIRSLTGGKTRLAGVLTPEARTALTRRMLCSVVRAALDSGSIKTVAVVSPDPAALDLAASLDPAVVPLRQADERPGLNPALAEGVAFAAGRGAAAALILFGDLPLLTGDDVRNLLRRDAPVVLAPDRHGTGTNALMLRLGTGPDDGRDFAFHFGPGSYAKHVDEAHRLGLDVATSLAAGTALDLDTPDDLRRVLSAEAVAGDEELSEIEPALRDIAR
ncbi:MAG TPA: 2-phospho-L-lactate guanylyltransferase [Thermomicrobiales bacterium]|jgi:2-phospho-L-lactate guanylyltransferase